MANLDEYRSTGTHRVSFYVNGNIATYLDNFGVEHIPKQIKKFIAQKSIITNIFRI